jgi:Tfp pilus assembly protein PilO
MKGRDRIVMMALAVAVVAIGGWILVVSPKKKEIKTYEAQVATAQTKLSSAESQLASAKSAQSQYATSYAAVVELGKAVPPSDEVASLVYELEQASNQHSVSFNSITSGGAGSTGSAPASSSTATAATAATGAGFTSMPFTFVFNGGYFDLEHLFHGLTGFTTHGSDGTLRVSGRLLTIQSVKLAPETTTSGRTPKLTGTVTATAYVLPAGQSVTAGATAAAPATTSSTAATSSSATTAPAVARVTP